MKTPKKQKKEPQAVAGRGSDKFILRLPDGMRSRIAALAAQNGRSMNTEIIAALEKYIEGEDNISLLWDAIAELQAEIQDLRKICA